MEGNLKKAMKKIKFDLVRLVIYIISIILVIYIVTKNIAIPCYWNENYGLICPSCGLTRATKNILQFNFYEAIKNNMFYTCIIIPFLFFLLINDWYIIFKRYILKKQDFSYIEMIMGYVKNE